MNLSLEGEMSDLGDIQVCHFQQLLHTLELVLKGEISVLIDITKVLVENGAVSTQVLLQLISELEALVQLDLQLYLGCKNLAV